jgi:hypothetical protein
MLFVGVAVSRIVVEIASVATLPRNDESKELL